MTLCSICRLHGYWYGANEPLQSRDISRCSWKISAIGYWIFARKNWLFCTSSNAHKRNPAMYAMEPMFWIQRIHIPLSFHSYPKIGWIHPPHWCQFQTKVDNHAKYRFRKCLVSATIESCWSSTHRQLFKRTKKHPNRWSWSSPSRRWFLLDCVQITTAAVRWVLQLYRVQYHKHHHQHHHCDHLHNQQDWIQSMSWKLHLAFFRQWINYQNINKSQK